MLLGGTVAAAGLAQLVLLRHGLLAVSFDDSGHALDAYRWLHARTAVSSGWLPGYRVLVGSALRLNPDLFTTPRMVSSVTGLLVLLAVIWLAHELFHDDKATLVAAVLAAFYPPRLILSVAPLTEIFFILGIVIAMAFLARWLARDRPLDALLSALSFALASTFRYEGWVFASSFVLVAAYRPLRRGGGRGAAMFAVMLAAVALAFPLVTEWRHTAGYGVSDVVSLTGESFREQGAGPASIIRNSVAGQFIRQNGATLNLVGLLVLLPLAAEQPFIRSWTAVPGLALLIMSAVTLTGRGVPNHTFWRVAAVWGVLLIPFTARWVVSRSHQLLPWARVARALALLLLIAAFGIETSVLAAPSSLTRADFDAGRALRRLIEARGGGDSTRVLIDSANRHYLHVRVVSSHPFAFVCNSGENPTMPDTPMVSGPGPLAPETLRALRRGGIRYLLVRSPELQALCRTTAGVDPRQTFGPWSLYEIADEQPDGRP